MKIFINGFWCKNLGDDLFLKIIADRYPDIQFYISSNDEYNDISPNIKNIGNRYINKFLRIVTAEKVNMSRLFSYFADTVIFLGGSIFIEKDSNYRFKMRHQQKYYVIGANFGPFVTDKYLEYHREFFAKAEDVCFRDQYSANIFRGIDKVRSAPDVVFNLKYVGGGESSNTAIVSVIDVSKRTDINEEEYEIGLIHIINMYQAHGYAVCLMSFCKCEGDEEAIARLMQRGNLKDIKKYCYRGDIDEALSVLSNSETIVGTRYHAVILALLLGKKVIPLAYSDKLINALQSMNYSGNIYDIRNSGWSDMIDFENTNLLRIQKKKIDEIIYDAGSQFTALDVLVQNERNNDKCKRRNNS